MSDGPLPESTRGVDTSPEAIAYHLKLVGDCHTARLLAQVAARAAIAERQLAEARAEIARLKPILEAARQHVEESGWHDRRVSHALDAYSRALLSGETTRVEDEP